MIYESKYPVLEFDTAENGVINPADFAKNRFLTDKLVITFFPEVLDKMLDDGIISLERRIPGENPVVIYKFSDSPDVLITLGYVGCPACAGNLDMFNAMGIEKVMFCGGGGVLDKNIQVGQLLLVEGAIRDEGFSYHYIEPSRYIYTDKSVTDTIAHHLDGKIVSYMRGITWTTDAIFRETADKVALRKSEGAKIVEMEQAGCIAVSQKRGFKYGALIYGGDDVSSDKWDTRSWRSRNGLRYDLVNLCKELTRLI